MSGLPGAIVDRLAVLKLICWPTSQISRRWSAVSNALYVSASVAKPFHGPPCTCELIVVQRAHRQAHARGPAVVRVGDVTKMFSGESSLVGEKFFRQSAARVYCPELITAVGGG